MVFQQINRQYYNKPDLDTQDNYGDADIIAVADPNLANLIGSKDDVNGNLHAPCLDIDYPIEVYPSSQVGHHHLYLNKLISWTSYKQVLLALSNAGLIETGYAFASIKAGQSYLRPVGVIKPGGVPETKQILVENAKLRQENYELKAQLKNYIQPLAVDIPTLIQIYS